MDEASLSSNSPSKTSSEEATSTSPSASSSSLSFLHQFDDVVKDTDIPRFLKEHKDTLRFPEMLLFLLVQAERDAAMSDNKEITTTTNNPTRPCIAWALNGCAVAIFNKDELIHRLLPIATSNSQCKATSFASFARKMYRWGFKLATLSKNGLKEANKKNGAVGDTKVFWHPHFQRDNKPLVLNMKSTTAEGTRRAMACLLKKKGSKTANRNNNRATAVAASPEIIEIESVGTEYERDHKRETTGVLLERKGTSTFAEGVVRDPMAIRYSSAMKLKDTVVSSWPEQLTCSPSLPATTNASRAFNELDAVPSSIVVRPRQPPAASLSTCSPRATTFPSPVRGCHQRLSHLHHFPQGVAHKTMFSQLQQRRRQIVVRPPGQGLRRSQTIGIPQWGQRRVLTNGIFPRNKLIAHRPASYMIHPSRVPTHNNHISTLGIPDPSRLIAKQHNMMLPAMVRAPGGFMPCNVVFCKPM